ncbi:hypothetical protein GN244_ATG01708 [Phytophthora infestans]|uniref:Secreted RxLR effector peptide protein n=1 Tax=Phytophthora infestans TaxID=4787 RepID=A0A833X1T7_PHYIN|nr:hypothetical protein GN244_ATG01708 [Phytophthora infestans]KAF4133600.1 hypothetical protein GN958_ATG16937 [Phytophthora infestans]
MNVVFRSLAVLFLLSMKASAIVFQQRVPALSLTDRRLQSEDNESEAADFLAQVTTAMLQSDPEPEDLSKFATFIEALMARASSRSGSPFSSNTSSTNGLTSGEEAAFQDVGSDFTPSPELRSMSDETDASVAPTDSSGDLEGEIDGDAAMTDGRNSAAKELHGVSIIAMTAFTVIVEVLY